MIIWIEKYDFIQDYKDLYQHVKKEFTHKKGRKYLFIDEIQEIEKWEKAVTSFFSEGNMDIFITGSNAHLLSSEIATLISGRYITPKNFSQLMDQKDLYRPSVLFALNFHFYQDLT